MLRTASNLALAVAILLRLARQAQLRGRARLAKLRSIALSLRGMWLGLWSRESLAEGGGYTGYVTDPDGHLWEVAWNPHFWIE